MRLLNGRLVQTLLKHNNNNNNVIAYVEFTINCIDVNHMGVLSHD